MRRFVAQFGTALLFSVAAIAVIGRLGRDWEARVEVRGHSMEPLLIDGDWLLVDPEAYARRLPSKGELVVARDPRAPERLLVKRAAATDADGSLTLVSDHPAHADIPIAPVAASDLVGRPWLRYWPLERFGRI